MAPRGSSVRTKELTYFERHRGLVEVTWRERPAYPSFRCRSKIQMPHGSVRRTIWASRSGGTKHKRGRPPFPATNPWCELRRDSAAVLRVTTGVQRLTYRCHL